jgi:predicted phage terminase large subunit-like protein
VVANASFLETGVLAPQKGPQEAFARTSADIALYGGAAFGGKSMALTMEPLRHIRREGFSAVIFRRTYPEIFAPGGLWDTAEMIYPAMGGVARQSSCEWFWPQYNSRVKFAHMQHEKDKFAWQSSQIPLLEFDELTHFSESVFWYMTSRNRLGRPMGGMRPYVRAACNPDSASWIANLIDWWIDPETGFPQPARAGVVRWFVRPAGQMIWADKREDLVKYGLPKSFTFVPSRIFDNKIGMETDPGYLANLQALPSFERAQLLDGNWKIRPSRGTRFKKHWFDVRDTQCAMVRQVRYWDRAGTEPNERNKDPDATAGVKWGIGQDGYFWILDCVTDKLTPGGVKQMIHNIAKQDGRNCELWLEEDPGQAGKAERVNYASDFAALGPRFNRPTGSKWVRSGPFSAAAENGRIRVLRGKWNKHFFEELEAFQDPNQLKPGEVEGHDDQVDAGSGGFSVISQGGSPSIS